MLSVIFSSFNGGGDLGRMLDSMAQLEAPPGGWRLIAVDNASSDGSGDVMRSYADRLPIVILTEPIPGKNVALNRALEIAVGDFYIFTDDDVVVRSDWLSQWRAVADAHLSYDLFAGRTLPLWPSEPPQWLLRGVEVGVLYAAHDEVQEEGLVAQQSCMDQAMAVRSSAFAEGVQFDVQIGPDGSANYPMRKRHGVGAAVGGQGLEMLVCRRSGCRAHRSPRASGPVVDPETRLSLGTRTQRASRLPFHCPPDVLVRKNNLKMLARPLVLPFLPRDDRWRRQWQLMVDRGYEDGTRDERGQRPRWV